MACRSMRFNGFSQIPDPNPEWPTPGGFSWQPAKLVEAFDLLRMEMHRLHPAKPDEDDASASDADARAARRERRLGRS